MAKGLIYETSGWYGAIIIILAYGLLNFDILTKSNILYQLMNATGALGILIISLKKKAYPPTVLNIIWMLIALFAIFSLL